MDDSLDVAAETIPLVPLGLLVRGQLRFSPLGTFGGDDTQPDEEILTALRSAVGAVAPSFPRCSMIPSPGGEQRVMRQEFGALDD
jgi:hypothetical protein